MMKKTGSVLVCLLCLLLSGCALRTVDALYCQPRRSAEYSSLQAAIDSAMGSLEYAAPVSGENQQAVQQADLDGDGTDEYLVFARSNTEKPLHILIFKLNGEEYTLLENLSCNGTAFEQVKYVDLDGRAGTDLLVGRQGGGQVARIVSLYSFAGGASEQIFSSIYARVLTCDLDSNGRSELMIIRYGASEQDNAVAVLYSWRNGTMERSREASLSGKAEFIKKISQSRLQSGEPAVYVAGAVNDSAIATDIFAMKDGIFSNISLTGDGTISVQTLRNYYLYGEDIDADGVLELPRLLTMKSTTSAQTDERNFLICWYAVDLQGAQTDKCYTFHNYDGGWYLKLDSSWINRLAMEQNGNSCTFYIWNEDYGAAQAVFTVTALTGTNREAEASENNRFALYRGETVVYAARLETACALYGITQESLTQSFQLIRQDSLAA